MAKDKKADDAFKAAQGAWDLWLSSKWEYSDRPDDAVARAVGAWLDRNGDRLIEAIAERVAAKTAGK